MRSGLILAAIAAFMLGGQACSADPITYNFVDYPSEQADTYGNGTWTLSGSMTTNGTIGTLTESEITSWTFTFTNGGTSYTASSTDENGYVNFNGSDFVASATAITVSASANGYDQLEFEGNPSGDQNTQLEYLRENNHFGYTSDSYTATGNGSNLWDATTNGSNTLPLGSASVWTIATAPSAVPEPSSLVMCGLGGIGVALAAWRRRRAATA